MFQLHKTFFVKQIIIHITPYSSMELPIRELYKLYIQNTSLAQLVYVSALIIMIKIYLKLFC